MLCYGTMFPSMTLTGIVLSLFLLYIGFSGFTALMKLHGPVRGVTGRVPSGWRSQSGQDRFEGDSKNYGRVKSKLHHQ